MWDVEFRSGLRTRSARPAGPGEQLVGRLAHVPVGWRPTQLVVRVRRLACTHCRRVRVTGHEPPGPAAILTRAEQIPNETPDRFKGGGGAQR